MRIYELESALRQGQVTVEQVIRAFTTNQVDVYPETSTEDGLETWQSVEEEASGTTIFADLGSAGASIAQMSQVAFEIQRARDEGRVVSLDWPA